MKDENGHRQWTNAQARARKYWSDYSREHPGEAPTHEFRISPMASAPYELTRFDLITWAEGDGKKYGWVTSQRGEAGPGGPVMVTVTEIPPTLSPKEAIEKTANPFPVELFIPPQPTDRAYRDAQVMPSPAGEELIL